MFGRENENEDLGPEMVDMLINKKVK